MNYQQYLTLKKNCKFRIKIFSFGMYVAALCACVQAGLLIFKVDLTSKYTNLFVLDTLFSMGYVRLANGNIVLSVAFYGAFGLLLFFIVGGAVLCYREKIYPYAIVLVLYLVDALICLATAQYYQLGIHVALMILIMLSIKDLWNLNLLKNNVWGYK